MTDIQTTPKFSAEMWAAFWDAPNMSLGQDILADDKVSKYSMGSDSRCPNARRVICMSILLVAVINRMRRR